MFVYQIVNKIDGKKYIGQSKLDPAVTRQQRLSGSYGLRLGPAIRKDGAENFDFQVVVYADNQEDSDRYEDGLILAYDTQNPTKGYNVARGGLSACRFKKPTDYTEEFYVTN